MYHYIIILQYNEIGVNIFINNIFSIAKIYRSKCNYVDIRIKVILQMLIFTFIKLNKTNKYKKLLAI